MSSLANHSFSFVFAFLVTILAKLLVNHLFVKSPVLPNLLAGHFALLGKFVERRLGNLQVLREFIDRDHCFGLHGRVP